MAGGVWSLLSTRHQWCVLGEAGSSQSAPYTPGTCLRLSRIYIKSNMLLLCVVLALWSVFVFMLNSFGPAFNCETEEWQGEITESVFGLSVYRDTLKKNLSRDLKNKRIFTKVCVICNSLKCHNETFKPHQVLLCSAFIKPAVTLQYK